MSTAGAPLDEGRDDRGVRAEREEGGARRGPGQPPEEGRPLAHVAGVLVRQHAHRTDRAHIAAGLDEAFLLFEEREAEPRAIAAHLGIDETVAERLENGAGFAGKNEGRNLREKFPHSEVADDVHDAFARSHGRL